MLHRKVKIIWIALFLWLSLLSRAESARMEKHVLVAYDISKSMRSHWDKEEIGRINGYLTALLFDGLGEISERDKVVFTKKSPLLGKSMPLLSPGDRLSFLKFGGPPIPSPELSEIYDGKPYLRNETTRRLPERSDEFKEDWTCLELLHWKASQIFRAYPRLEPHLIVLISDKSESRYPLSLEDQKRILWYKEKYKEEILLDLQVGVVHLEVSRSIPPASRIDVLEPKPWKLYYAGKPLLIRVQMIKEGEVLKEEGWKVVAGVGPQDRPREKKDVVLNDKGFGEDEQADDGIYSGAFLGRKGGPIKILINTSKGPLKLQSEELHLMLSSPPGPPAWLLITASIILGLVLWHLLWPLRFWIERKEIGGPPRKTKLKKVGDILFLGKREEEAYLDLGLPQYSILRQKRKEVTLWREGKEEGEIVPWERWFSPLEEEGIVLRFSLRRPRREGHRQEEIKAAEVEVEGEDFYKL